MKRITVAATFIVTLVLASLNLAAQTESREDLLKEMELKRAELAALEEKFLAPAAADREANAAFLATDDTGIIRLLPREKFDDSSNKAKKALTMRGGGAYYSFTRLTHEYGYGSDIELQQGNLIVGFAGADYGLMLNLGDVSLEQVTADNAAVRALLEYTVPVKEVEVRAEARKLWQGIDLSGFLFKKHLPAEVSNTYLLRSIAPRDSDVAVTFRVVRQDTDGSIILIYKVLKKFPAPKFERSPIPGEDN